MANCVNPHGGRLRSFDKEAYFDETTGCYFCHQCLLRIEERGYNSIMDLSGLTEQEAIEYFLSIAQEHARLRK